MSELMGTLFVQGVLWRWTEVLTIRVEDLLILSTTLRSIPANEYLCSTEPGKWTPALVLDRCWDCPTGCESCSKLPGGPAFSLFVIPASGVPVGGGTELAYSFNIVLFAYEGFAGSGAMVSSPDDEDQVTVLADLVLQRRVC